MSEPTRWGPWEFDRDRLTLTHVEEDYEVDLERCLTSAEVLDWIAQIEGKVWGTPDVVGNLVSALCNLLHPQATLCSGGHGKTIAVDDVAAIALRGERETRICRRAEPIEPDRQVGSLHVVSAAARLRAWHEAAAAIDAEDAAEP